MLICFELWVNKLFDNWNVTVNNKAHDLYINVAVRVVVYNIEINSIYMPLDVLIIIVTIKDKSYVIISLKNISIWTTTDAQLVSSILQLLSHNLSQKVSTFIVSLRLNNLRLKIQHANCFAINALSVICNNTPVYVDTV